MATITHPSARSSAPVNKLMTFSGDGLLERTVLSNYEQTWVQVNQDDLIALFVGTFTFYSMLLSNTLTNYALPDIPESSEQ